MKCSGLPSRKDWFSDFVCPRCVASTGTEQSRTESPPDHAALSNPTPHVTQATVSQTPPEEPSVSDFWTKVSPEVATQIRNFYNEIVHWRPCFQTLTKNKTGHKFVETLDCLLKPIAENSQHSPLSFYVALLLPHLVLARTTSDPDTSRNKVIARRLSMWLNGEIEPLFHEAEALQKRMPKSKSKHQKDEFKNFDVNMTSGKISNALRCINDADKGGVLSLTEIINGKSVLDILKEKDPPPGPCHDQYITQASRETPPYHPVIFDRIQAGAVQRAAMRTQGSHGPSGVDANEWRRWLSNFGQSSTSLCRTIAQIAVRIATVEIECESKMPYNACRLIPLDKNPGVRP